MIFDDNDIGSATVYTMSSSLFTSDGTYTWYVRGQRYANSQWSSEASATFVYDTTKPTVLDFYTSDPTTRNLAPTFCWTTNDALSGIQRVELWRTKANGETCLNGTESACQWTLATTSYTANTGNNNVPDNSLSADGVYYYGIHAIDNAGNCTREDGQACNATLTATNLKQIIYDIAPPILSLASPAEHSWIGSITNLTWAYSDAGVGVDVCNATMKSLVGGAWTNTAIFQGCNNLTAAVSAAPTGYCNQEGMDKCRLVLYAKDKFNQEATKNFYFGADFSNPGQVSLTIEGSPTLSALNFSWLPVTDQYSGINHY